MSRWQEQLKNHQIHETLNTLEKLSDSELDDLEEDEIQERRRFKKIISVYKVVLGSLDPELVPIPQIDSLNTELQNNGFMSQVNYYSQNGSLNDLIAANDYLSNHLTSLSLLLSFTKSVKPEPIILDLEKSVDYISNVITNKKDNFQSQLDEFEKTVSNVQGKLETLENTIDTRKSETDAQLSQWQQQFSEAQERRNTEFSSLKDNFDTESRSAIEKIIQQSQDKLDEEHDRVTEEIDHILEDSRKKHSSILDLYQLTAGDSVSGGYQKSAQNERNAANNWRKISVGFIILTAGWLAFAYCQPAILNSSGEAVIIWPKLLSIVTLTGVLLFGAAFSAQQSNRHRANEKRMLWFSLQMKAIDPYIFSLDDDVQKELKKSLSEKFFSNPELASEQEGNILDEHALKVVVKAITDILGKIPKS